MVLSLVPFHCRLIVATITPLFTLISNVYRNDFSSVFSYHFKSNLFKYFSSSVFVCFLLYEYLILLKLYYTMILLPMYKQGWGASIFGLYCCISAAIYSYNLSNQSDSDDNLVKSEDEYWFISLHHDHQTNFDGNFVKN